MQGLWTIEFGSNVGVYGSGVIVMRDGKIKGGDASYYYDGSYEVTDPVDSYPTKLKAKITARPFLPGAISVFKTYGEDFTLDLEGTLKDENNAVAIGKPEGIPEMNMKIRMIRRPEAA
jgi:hypothetical protein